MFTIIDEEIYQVSGDKMRKVIIDNGVIKTDGKVIDYDNSSILITSNELRRQYAKLFEIEENNVNASDDELLKKLDEKDSKIELLEADLAAKEKQIDGLKKEIESLEQSKNKDEEDSKEDEKDNLSKDNFTNKK